MQNLTEKQKKKILKLADFADNKDLAMAESLIKLEEDLEELESKLEQAHLSNNKALEEKAEEIRQSIASIVIPASVDHSQAIKELKDKIEEPQEITVSLNII